MSPEKKIFDVIIIGAGPAGLSAGIYTARDRLNSLLLERGVVGGQILNAGRVDNYPGFPEGVSGEKLTGLMYEQAGKYGLSKRDAEVTGVKLTGKTKIVQTSSGDLSTRSVIIASGSERQKLGVPGEEKYTGRGVSYCATCDAAFFGEKTVAVIGGGNAALAEAFHLGQFASKITIIHRRSELRATRIVQEKAFADPKIEFLWDTVVEEVLGDDFVRTITTRNAKTGKKGSLKVDGVFVAIGLKPNTGFLNGAVRLDESGAVMVNARMETEIPGVYAAGDVRHNSVWQMVAAVGDGAVAALSARRFLAE